MLGQFRDSFPRVLLTLPGTAGPVPIEFIIDTGFEGELALPSSVVQQLNVQFAGREIFALADASLSERVLYKLFLEWDEEPRLVEVLVLDGNPLLGTLFLRDHYLQVEMREGGEVVIEPL